MIHSQLLSLLSYKSLICYLVNIVTLKIQKLNQWVSLSVTYLEYTNCHALLLDVITGYMYKPWFKELYKVHQKAEEKSHLNIILLLALLLLLDFLWCTVRTVSQTQDLEMESYLIKSLYSEETPAGDPFFYYNGI